MKTVEFKQEDLVNVNELTEQRNDKIEHLNDVLKMNDSITEKKSLELLQDIFKINSQLKLEEDKLIVKTLGWLDQRNLGGQYKFSLTIEYKRM